MRAFSEALTADCTWTDVDELDDQELIVDALVVARVQRPDGSTAVFVDRTQHSDVVTVEGLLACAREIQNQQAWDNRGDE
jgi:hypothetical protein